MLRVWNTHPQVTVRAVAHGAGRSVQTTHAHLRRLRTLGLITWDDNQAGTIHHQNEDTMTNTGKWDPWYTGLNPNQPQPYGDTTTGYR